MTFMTVLHQCALKKQTNKQTEKKKTKQNKTKTFFFEKCTGFCFLENGSPVIKKKITSLDLIITL